MNGSTPRLEPSIKGHLSPVLVSDGFVGSGLTFRRVSGHLIQVLQVQGSRGGKFAINLGIQPLSIPDVVGNAPDPGKIKVELCEFRRRLSESERRDQWWEHAASKQGMDAAVRAAAAVYLAVGRRPFLEQAGPEAPLHTITPAQFESGQYSFSGFGSTKVRMARSLALMRQSVGS